jgi:hypothetical protein
LLDDNETAVEPHEPIPFSDPKQEACLGYILFGEGEQRNRNFFLQAQRHIKPDWFAEPFCQKICAAAMNFYKELGRIPSVSEVEESKDFRHMDQAYINKIRLKIGMCQARMAEYGLDLIKRELTDWLHVIQAKKRVYEIQNHFNRKDTDKIVSTLQLAAREIADTNFDEDKCVVWEDFSVFDRQIAELNNALTFGIEGLDRLLTPAATKGSLLRGDTTVILAPSNIGKTTTLITIAVANVMQRKNVLFLSHEGRGDDLYDKFWCAILRCTKPQLYYMYRQYSKNPEIREKMNYALAFMKAHLTYIPVNKPGLMVEEVAATIRRYQEDKKTKTGFGYDMMLDDYPAKLSSVIMTGREAARRHNDDYVYNYFVQMALEFNWHCVDAIQTNRDGSKVNRGDEDRLVFMEDVSESWGPMTSATNVISINRTPRMEATGYVTYNICKSRSSERGWAVACKSRYDCAVAHSNELGCTWYKGGTTMETKIDSLLAKYENQAIPLGDMRN